MSQGYSKQFGCPSVVLASDQQDADEVIAFAESIGAVHFADLRYYVVEFPGRSAEVWTERALRGSLKRKSA